MANRSIATEFLRALCVLAVAFLNFAHQAPALAKATPVDVLAVASALSFCGDGADLPDNRAHMPCHACRLGAAADLPPTPAFITIPGEHTQVRYAAALPHSAGKWPTRDQLARGPPAHA